MRGLCWCVCVAVVVVVMQFGGAASSTTTIRRHLRQVALDCSAPSCCGRTEASVGCRYQGNKCRCPFIVPTPVVYLENQPYHYYPPPGGHQNSRQRQSERRGHYRSGAPFDSNPRPLRHQYDQGEGERRTQGGDKDKPSSIEPGDLEKPTSEQED